MTATTATAWWDDDGDDTGGTIPPALALVPATSQDNDKWDTYPASHAEIWDGETVPVGGGERDTSSPVPQSRADKARRLVVWSVPIALFHIGAALVQDFYLPSRAPLDRGVEAAGWFAIAVVVLVFIGANVVSILGADSTDAELAVPTPADLRRQRLLVDDDGSGARHDRVAVDMRGRV